MRTYSLTINSQNITLYESVGSGPTAILVHGNSLSALTYRYQLEGFLGDKFHLVALDLPGHGLSDHAANPGSSYTLQGFAEIVTQVADELELNKAVFIGWSLGGHILLEAMAELNKASGFVIFGAPPIGNPTHMNEAFKANPALSNFFTGELTDDSVRELCTNCFGPGLTELPEIFTSSVRKTDKRVREVLGESISKGYFKDEIMAIESLKQPVVVIHGINDQFVSGSYLQNLNIPTLWRGSVQMISGAGHCPHWEASEEFNQLIEDFIEDVSV